MKITIKNIKGETFNLEVDPSESILDIKSKIKAIKNLDTDTQKLILKGQIVSDEKKVMDYNIKEGDLLVLMTTKKTTSNVAEPKKEELKKEVPKQPQPPVNPNPLTNNLVLGENYNQAINDICTMGFAREDVVKAMQAAFNNPDRAIEYLINGIPNVNANVPVGQPNQQNLADNEEESQPGLNLPSPGVGQEGVNSNDPMINQIRQAIRNDPNFLQSMMSNLATTNPQLFQAISSNPEQFLNLLGEEGGEGGEGGEELFDDEEEVEIPLTEEDNKAIDRLCALGFEKHTVVEAYMACEKNEEMTANFLFDNGHNFGN